jgi:wyosine [tRNA(Phe)-imidazoG37] synthetase (radical SAM superfamily)
LGRTAATTTERTEFFPFDEISDDLGKWLENGGESDYVTLAGSGEPTLYSRFGEVVDFIHDKTDIPVLLLTNGSLLWLPEVRKEAAKADVVKISLSAWNQKMFEIINRPAAELRFEQMLEGEIAFRNEFGGKLILEVFLLAGINAIRADMERIAERVNLIKPDVIHFNTVTRPAAEKFAMAAHVDKMRRFTELFTPTAEIVADVPAEKKLTGSVDEESVLALIRRRPATMRQLADTFGAHPNEVAKVTGRLQRSGAIQSVSEQGAVYFESVRND